MKINGYILAHQMWGVIDFKLHSDKRKGILSHIAIYDENMPIIPDCIYVLNKNKFVHQQVDFVYTVVMVGEPPEKLITDDNCDFICCRENFDLRMLFFNIQEIFTKYNLWEENLTNVLINQGSLDELCCLSASIFQNPLEIFGCHSEVLAMGEAGEYYRLNYRLKAEGSNFISDEININMLYDSEYDQTYKTTESTAYSVDDKYGLCIYENIFINGDFWGNIVVDAIYRDCNDGDYYPLEFLTSILKIYFIISMLSF